MKLYTYVYKLPQSVSILRPLSQVSFSQNMHVIQETRRLSDECSIQNQSEKTFYGVSENEIVHLTSEILMSHNLRKGFILVCSNSYWLTRWFVDTGANIHLKTNMSSHLANIRMILQVRMNTLIDQQQLEQFLKQYPGIDDTCIGLHIWRDRNSNLSSMISVFSNQTRNNFIFANSSTEPRSLWFRNINFKWKCSPCLSNIWRYYNSKDRYTLIAHPCIDRLVRTGRLLW